MSTAAPGGDRGPAPVPTLRVERQLLRQGYRLIAGVDEVGRGAWSGPVSVGVAVVDAAVSAPPPGLRDSKLLPPARREALVPQLRSWVRAGGVGHATASEIDAGGIIVALRAAFARALAALPLRPEVVVLDGGFDYLTMPGGPDRAGAGEAALPVVTLVGADRTCASVAAASVLAKTERDALMRALASAHPGYGWETNMGYGTAAHRDALRTQGPCGQHRRSWRLPVQH